jgi:hypothetical protein
MNPSHKNSGDTLYTVNATHTSFRVSLKEIGQLHQKKFVRIHATKIINPKLIAITFNLYYISRGHEEFLGSVAPFPANNPGSFIIATRDKLTKEGELELRLNFPKDWNKKDSLEVKIQRLSFE